MSDTINTLSKTLTEEGYETFTLSTIFIEEGDENIPDNHQENDCDAQYVRKQCIHDSCDDKSVRISVPKINPQIAEEVAEEAYNDLEEETNKGGLDETLGASDFTDGDCGEPMHSQFLRLDFTPVEGIDDNPHLLAKCSDFWQFICSEPQLQGLMSSPEIGYEKVVAAASSSETSLMKCRNIATPAMKWLETGVGQKLAFAVNHQSKYCDHFKGDYMNEVPPPNNREASQRKKSSERGCHQTRASSRSELPATEKSKLSSSNAVDLCMQLDKWDQQHSKPIDPPTRVPNLTLAVLQRKKQEC